MTPASVSYQLVRLQARQFDTAAASDAQAATAAGGVTARA